MQDWESKLWGWIWFGEDNDNDDVDSCDADAVDVVVGVVAVCTAEAGDSFLASDLTDSNADCESEFAWQTEIGLSSVGLSVTGVSSFVSGNGKKEEKNEWVSIPH